MMNRPPEHDPLAALRRADPAPLERLRGEIGASDRRAARAKAIEAAQAGAESRTEAGSSRSGVRPRALAALAAAGLAAAALVLAFAGGPVGPAQERAFAGSAVEVAEANPRLLVGAPGWAVLDAGEFEPDLGSMVFGNGEHRLALDWSRLAAEARGFGSTERYTEGSQGSPRLGQWYRSPAAVVCATAMDSSELEPRGKLGPINCDIFARATEIEVLGLRAILAETRTVYPGRESSSFLVALPAQQGTEVSFHANSMSRAELLGILDSLRRVDVETWLDALPPRLVDPLERPEVVEEMLADVPLPASVDVAELQEEQSAASRYHLGAAVTAAVACGWLDQWAAALRTGGTRARADATRAMQTSFDWAILEEMDEGTNGWPELVWEYADQMRADDRAALLGSAGTTTYADGSVYAVGPSYATGLGCESERREFLRKGSPFGPARFRGTPVDAPPRPAP